MTETTLILADDHRMFLEGLSAIIQNQEGLDVVGTVQTGKELISLLSESGLPDMIILDLNMPEMEGIEALISLKKRYKDLKIIALTMYDEIRIVKNAFKEGIDGYVLKDASVEELFRAIQKVQEGERFIGTGVNLTMELSAYSKARADTLYNDGYVRRYNLTRRETEILLLIAKALSNKEIAKELYISDQTVSVHRKNLMRKIGVNNTAGLIKFAYDKRII